MDLPILIPQNESPETLGKAGRVAVEGGLGMERRINLHPNLNPASIHQDRQRGAALYPQLGATLGVLKWLDLSPMYPLDLRMKFQFLGLSRDEAQHQNVSMALLLRGNYIDARGAGGSSSSPGLGASYQIDTHSTDLSLIVGYRLDEFTMFYGGPFIGRTFYSGNYSSTTLGIADTSISGRATQYGLNSGLEISWYGEGPLGLTSLPLK